jgi:prolyl-tRNA synthetase
MRLSTYNFKTRKETPSDADSANAALLTRGRFIERGMTGVYNFLPLGWMVMENIMAVVHQNMNATGAYEARFTTLQDKALWEKTGRWESLHDVMYQFKDLSGREVGLGCTHEEVVMDILSRQPLSYTDFPYKLYQFQTKFRHEPRAKSGLLRGREFIMKDLYSAHTGEEDQKAYYRQVGDAYLAIFNQLGIPAIETLASGGIFTDNFSHEYQTLSPVGEDEIFVCKACNKGINKEVIDKAGHKCPECGSTDLTIEKSIEVGNIFDLGTFYSEKMDIHFMDKDGSRKPFWFASYGIGISRAMGTIVELHHDDKGIIWPESVAPFALHLVGLSDTAESVYESLAQAGCNVLFDDRPISAGEKFADADLLGMPVRLTVGNKTPKGQVEWKERDKDEVLLMSVEQSIQKLKLRNDSF